MSRRALAVTIAALAAALVLGSCRRRRLGCGRRRSRSTPVDRAQQQPVRQGRVERLRPAAGRVLPAVHRGADERRPRLHGDLLRRRLHRRRRATGCCTSTSTRARSPARAAASSSATARTPASSAIFTDATLATGVFASVGFAPTPDACPTPAGAAISAAAPTRPTTRCTSGRSRCAQPPAKLGVNYIPANSEDGRSNFVNGLNDFAVTGHAVHRDQKTALDKAGRTFQYAPLTTSGLVLAYKVFDQDAAHAEPGAQVTDLKLTPAAGGQASSPARSPTGTSTRRSTSSTPGHVFPPLGARRWSAATTPPPTSSSRPG